MIGALASCFTGALGQRVRLPAEAQLNLGRVQAHPALRLGVTNAPAVAAQHHGVAKAVSLREQLAVHRIEARHLDQPVIGEVVARDQRFLHQAIESLLHRAFDVVERDQRARAKAEAMRRLERPDRGIELHGRSRPPVVPVIARAVPVVEPRRGRRLPARRQYHDKRLEPFGRNEPAWSSTPAGPLRRAFQASHARGPSGAGIALPRPPPKTTRLTSPVEHEVVSACMQKPGCTSAACVER